MPASPDPASVPSGGDARLAEALAAYVPPLVLENLALDSAPPAGARVTTFTGVVLLTDIAGFTTLTERMDAAGPAGVEELSRLLNACFTDLIDLIEAHGGHVMKFAGDALVAVWTGTGETPAESAHRAAQCALFLQGRMSAAPAGDDAALTMRVSLGAGDVRHMVLGGTGERWVSRLVGTAMRDALAAIEQAEPGGVTLSSGFARLLAAVAQTTTLPDGGTRLHAVRPLPPRPVLSSAGPPRDVAALLGHVPAAVRDRIVAGQGGWVAEFLHVSVLFINVPEVDDDPARSLDRAQAVVRLIQTVLGRYEGTVDNLGDDHAGLTLVAALGLPGWAHEDDAARAVRIALAVRNELRGLGFASAIGVTTGRLFCGAIGSPRRRAYSMVGDTMNRCARLMALADNDVVCDEATRQAATRHFHFEFLRTEGLRGRAGSVDIYRPLSGVAAQHAPRRGIVGRVWEREVLRERLAALQDRGQASVVVIEGEAGIGKSTLVAEFRAVAAEARLRVLSGGGDSLERANSYHAWQGVFGDVCGFPPEADEAERAEVLQALLAGLPGAEHLAPLLNPALGLHLAETELTAEMTGRPRAEATSALLVQLLAGASVAEPLVVVLEDAHWADSASLALALELPRKVPRLLLLLATRPPEAPVPEAWTALREAAGGHCIALGPLAGEDVLALVRRRLEVTELPTPVAHFIWEKAEGHPFFSEELAYALRDAGNLVIRDGRCALAPGMGDLRSRNFPANVQGVVSERIARLSPRERLAIKIASVNGRSFSLGTLRAIYPVEEDHEHLPACLERLVGLDFTQRAGTGPEPAFLFKHNIIQEVAYEQLLFGQRQQLHGRLAEFLERQDGANYPKLAYHWRHTATPARAVPYLDLAGGEALRRYANREAIEFLAQAIQLVGGALERPAALTLGRWHRQIGEAHHHLGRIEESRRWLAEAMGILGHPVPASMPRKMLGLSAAATRQVWHRLRRSGRAPRGAAPAEVLVEAVEADNQLGEIAYFTNDLPTSVFHIIHGLNLAEALGPSDKLAEMYAAMMILTGALPVRGLGDLYFRLTEVVLVKTERPLTRAYVEQLMSIFFIGRGSFARARERLDPAMETFGRFGHGRRLEECFLNRFYLHFYRGEFAAARATAEELQRSAARREDAQTLGWAAMVAAEAALPIDGPAAALAKLGDAELPAWDALTRTAFHATAAVALFRLGEMERARDHAQRALDRLAAGPPVSYTALRDCSHVAEVFLGLWEHAHRARWPVADLEAQARRACRTMRTFSRAFPIGAARAHLWTGVERWQRGRAAAAEKSWRQGLAAAERLAMPHDRARLHAHLALVQGESERARAAELFTQLGAHAELAQAGGSVQKNLLSS